MVVGLTCLLDVVLRGFGGWLMANLWRLVGFLATCISCRVGII